ncbi:MAG: hypothetical protein ACFCVA_05965 [Gammaproteobacteria bacterium]
MGTISKVGARRRRTTKQETAAHMFIINMTPEDIRGTVRIVGRPSRKNAGAFVNIPVSQEMRNQLGKRIVGSLAMGTSALLQWALQELERQGVSIEAQAVCPEGS